MNDDQGLLEQRLSRQDLLKLAAVAGGAGLLAGHTTAAGAALDLLAAESGRLQVLDWAGYGYDGGQAMFAAYDKKYPKNKPKFTVMANEADASGSSSMSTGTSSVRTSGVGTSPRAASCSPGTRSSSAASQPADGEGGSVQESSTGSRRTGATTRSSTARTR